MEKYIDADVLKKVIYEYRLYFTGQDEDVMTMYDIIGEIPAADVEPVKKWTSVEDREPTSEGKYLVAILNGGKYHTTIRKWKANAGWCRTGAWERSTGGVRFWQPLPEPPKMDGGSEE